ncbi:MAG: PadR family transcriptional regulator [Acidobacteriota bacterium]
MNPAARNQSTKQPTRLTKTEQDLYIGLVRLHVLHHASEEPIFGLGMMQELGRHGYRLGAGTMYPLLHGMERRGWLRSEEQLVSGRKRKVYVATAAGRRALAKAREQVRELYEEMCGEEDGK